MAEQSKIADEGHLHKYFAQIPNTVIRGLRSRGLSVHAKWLYVYLKSVAREEGTCTRSTSLMAEEADMSRTKVSEAKKELAMKKLIVVTSGKNPGRDPDHIRIKDIWAANMQEFSVRQENTDYNGQDKYFQQDKEASVLLEYTENGQCTPGELQCTPGELTVLQANTALIDARAFRKDKDKDKDKDKEEDPLISPQGELPTSKLAQAKLDAKAVLAHLNTLTGRRYTITREIAARLQQGATCAECLMVLDWWAAVKVPQAPEQAQYFDNQTPFRPTKFDKYRAMAEAWDQQGRVPFVATNSHHATSPDETIEQWVERKNRELAQEGAITHAP